jgi:hypothetical protein
MALKRRCVGCEYNGAISNWQDRFDFFLAVSAPEFERAAKILFPVLVQVNYQSLSGNIMQDCIAFAA